MNLDGLFDGNLMVKLMRCIYNVYIYIYIIMLR